MEPIWKFVSENLCFISRVFFSAVSGPSNSAPQKCPNNYFMSTCTFAIWTKGNKFWTQEGTHKGTYTWQKILEILNSEEAVKWLLRKVLKVYRKQAIIKWENQILMIKLCYSINFPYFIWSDNSCEFLYHIVPTEGIAEEEGGAKCAELLSN